CLFSGLPKSRNLIKQRQKLRQWFLKSAFIIGLSKFHVGLIQFSGCRTVLPALHRFTAPVPVLSVLPLIQFFIIDKYSLILIFHLFYSSCSMPVQRSYVSLPHRFWFHASDNNG